jgi:predicted nucleic acid-binding Zn ribbon protein
MTSAKDVAFSLDTHEQVCSERYKSIEQRLESGSERFDRLEKLIWGIYILLITSVVMPALVSAGSGL